MTEEELQEIAQELNEECPKKIEDNTHLVRVTSGPGMNMIYVYEFSEDALQTLTKEKLNNIKEGVKAHYRANGDLKIYRDIKVTLNFVYCDSKGKELMSVESK